MARYIPGNVPTNPADLPEYLRTEQAKIAQAMETKTERVTYETLYSAPKKYGDGTTVKADGTTWNPGSGSGLYIYRDSAWHLLG